MVLIFEGLDNTGKTTQISLLKKDEKFKDFKVIHSGVPKDWKTEYINEFKKFDKENLIYDRLHGGETVYGSIYRNTDEKEVYELEKMIEDLDVYLFVFIDEVDNLLKRDDGKSISTDKEKIKQEIDKFISFYNNSKIRNKALININKLSIDDVSKIISKFLNHSKKI